MQVHLVFKDGLHPLIGSAAYRLDKGTGLLKAFFPMTGCKVYNPLTRAI
jgi:hypothetical protein